jgi:hypothetical protein
MMHSATDQELHSNAERLERAYRMALGLEAATRQRLGDSDPPFVDLAQWLLASELLSILDELRSGLQRGSVGPG